MGVQYEIKKLSPEHWFVYKHLRLVSLREDPQAFIGIHEEKLKLGDEIWQSHFAALHNRILFAFEGNEAVGMVSYDINHNSKNSHVANIYSLFVLPDYRKKGLGKHLLEAVISDIEKNHSGVIKVKLAVSSSQIHALNLYESLGFKKVGTYKMEIKVGEEFFDELLLEKFIK